MNEELRITSHESPEANEMAQLLKSQELRDKIGVEIMREEMMAKLLEKYGEGYCDKTQMFHLVKGSNAGIGDDYYDRFDFTGDDSISEAIKSEELLKCPEEKVQEYIKKYS
jgi:hypothetical protein